MGRYLAFPIIQYNEILEASKTAKTEIKKSSGLHLGIVRMIYPAYVTWLDVNSTCKHYLSKIFAGICRVVVAGVTTGSAHQSQGGVWDV